MSPSFIYTTACGCYVQDRLIVRGALPSLLVSINTLTFCGLWSDNRGVLSVKCHFDYIKMPCLIRVSVCVWKNDSASLQNTKQGWMRQTSTICPLISKMSTPLKMTVMKTFFLLLILFDWCSWYHYYYYCCCL